LSDSQQRSRESLSSKIERLSIGHAASVTTQIILRRYFPERERSRLRVLKNTSQETAYGHQIMGKEASGLITLRKLAG
jgi:hypothetical protein